MRRQCLFLMLGALMAFVFFPLDSHTAIDVEMVLNNGGFESHDHFKADLFLDNDSAEVPGAKIFGILDIEGVYYFWPDFEPEVDYRTITIAMGRSYVSFLDFDFPDMDDIIPYGPMKFWGAWHVDGDRYGYDVAEFWLDGEHKWTPTPTPPQDFVFIPAGTFRMGSPADEICRDTDENPIHTVTLTHDFFIQSTEVTQQQWVDVFGKNPAYFTGMNRPVESMTWYECCIYCNRLSLAEGLTPCYYSDASCTTVFDGTPPVESGTVYWKQSADGYRLPTEAEWEYACRAGTTTAYNSGENNTSCHDDPNLDPLGRYYYNGGSSSEHAEVGSYQPNNWGLYDMHGNVGEWCWDWYRSEYSSSSPATDPTGPPTGVSHVKRGGSWNHIAMHCRSASRFFSFPGSRGSVLGFRVLRPVN